MSWGVERSNLGRAASGLCRSFIEDGSDHDRILTPAHASPGRRPQPPTRSKVRNRCISPAAGHSGDCLLSEPIAGTLSLAAGTRLHAPKPALPDASYEASDLFSFVTLRGSVRRRGGIVENVSKLLPSPLVRFCGCGTGVIGMPRQDSRVAKGELVLRTREQPAFRSNSPLARRWQYKPPQSSLPNSCIARSAGAVISRVAAWRLRAKQRTAEQAR